MSKSDTGQRALWQESAVAAEGPVAGVIPIAALDRVYSYAIPPELDEQVQPGCRVEVPFGKAGKPRIGFCVSVERQEWTTTLKPIIAVIDERPLLSPTLLELGEWMAEYYAAPLGKTLEAMLPAAVRKQSGYRKTRYVRLVPDADASSIRMTDKRQALLDCLAELDGEATIAALNDEGVGSPAIIRSLEEAGLIEVITRREPAEAPRIEADAAEPTFTLNTDQQNAIASITSWLEPSTFRVGVLYGVTGSGKTEVYVQTIRTALARDRQAIVLVPEIALTAQTTMRLAKRFDDVVVLHSRLTQTQRSLAWNEIAQGKRRVVIGTRSAVFAPCPSLGLIVVDEEQEASFKNQQNPRFHTRDVAIKRAHIAGIPIVLGSATPSLETWANLERFEHYECLRLNERVANQPMPKITVVDMHNEHRERPGIHMLSRAMEQCLGETLERGEQAILLLNRRGYASFLFCPKCNHRLVCPRCDTNLVFHKTSGFVHCHYCSVRLPVPNRCPNENCKHKLVRFGMGTQRVEEELRWKFAGVRAARVDTDAIQRTTQMETLLTAFERRELDVLVGTQMIAKGLDFPFVSFVGMVSADTAMMVPDFRANERTFQLITQVAGRAGRGDTPGHVVVQTFTAALDAIRYAATHDFERFAESELAKRAKMHLPPYVRLVRVILADQRGSKAQAAAEALKKNVEAFAKQAKLAVTCWGPNRCAIQRIRLLHRFELLIKSPKAADLAEIKNRLRHDSQFIPKVRQFKIDVDPVSLL